MSEVKVRNIIQNSPKKFCLLDPLPTWLSIKCLVALNPILTNIVNASLSLSNVPRILKVVIIRRLLKQINLSLIFKNYRPVSNTKYISKIIEHVILEQPSEHLLTNNIYEHMQSAYRQYDILRNVDNQRVTVLLLLDLSSAAFDTVSHRKLLHRLRERIGVQGNALKWFESYLEDRKQAIA